VSREFPETEDTVPRMGVVHVLGVLLLSLLSPGHANPISEEDNCATSNNLGQEIWSLKESVSNMIPRDAYMMALKYGFGDHINWESLESYSIVSAKWKKDLVDEMDEIYRHFKELVKRHSNYSTPYHHWHLFRAPDNVNDLWLTEVSLSSDPQVHFFDKINMVLNGGIFSDQKHSFYQYRSHEKDRLVLLTNLSEMLNSINLGKDFSEYLAMVRNEGFQMSVMEYLEENLKNDVACYYSTLAAMNLTFFNTFTQTVPEDKLVEYCHEFASKAFVVINSAEIEPNFNSVTDAVKKNLRNTDFDSLTAKLFLSFLRQRSLVLGVDIREVFQELDNLHRTIGEGWNSLVTGQWPEMLEFMSTFMRKTVKSEVFWQKLDDLYHDLVQASKDVYLDRERWLEENIRTGLLPFMRSLMEKLELSRTADQSQVNSLVRMIEAVDLIPYLEQPLDQLISVTSRHFLSCYTALYGKPDFNQMSEMTATNPVISFMKSVVVVDWPEEQKVPEKFPEFVENLQEAVLLLLSSSLGSCSHPSVGRG